MKSRKVMISLPRELARRAKKAAVNAVRTLAEIVKSALQRTLTRRRRKKTKRKFKVITYGSGGLYPGVDLDNTSSLLDIMEPPDEIRRKMSGSSC